MIPLEIRYNWIPQIIKWPDKVQGFKVLLKQWIVERTFDWFENYAVCVKVMNMTFVAANQE